MRVNGNVRPYDYLDMLERVCILLFHGENIITLNAETFKVPETVDRCYFFNPFSLELLKRVVGRILDSYYANLREMQLFFYYPTDEYISYMMTVDELMFVDEIDCKDLFPGNDPREKIVIFELKK